MYVPKLHAETDPQVLHALIRAHPLGTWITRADASLVANHVPFLLDATRGEVGVLRAHVARANPVWRALSPELDSLVVFQGAEAYITPSWYPAKREHGKAVPTWNYAVVHAHGRARAVQDREWLRELVTRLTAEHERARSDPWQVADAPADYIERLLDAIVGIEIPLTRLVGKWKVSQNRGDPDRRGVVAGLLAEGRAQSHAMAALVRERIVPEA